MVQLPYLIRNKINTVTGPPTQWQSFLAIIGICYKWPVYYNNCTLPIRFDYYFYHFSWKSVRIKANGEDMMMINVTSQAAGLTTL